jgi:tetratricopeptide (TPR) repeat protein
VNKPLCFVLMPFGNKPDAAGAMIDFDAVYQQLLAPAISEAGMEPLRADEEMTGGIIHKPMFERLILCEYAVADLTTANANVFYELGVRHAVRPWSTVLLFSKGGSQLPFDVAPLRAMPYQLGTDGTPAALDKDKKLLVERLTEARQQAADEPATDSPIYQLIEGFPGLEHSKTDVFREQVKYAAERKSQLAAARKDGVDAVRALEKEFAPISDLESGVIIDLFLSYRAVKAWDDMIALVGKMPRPLASTVMVREQLAFALNRMKRREEAEQVLLKLIDERGPSSETYGLLGRVYKDRWEETKERAAETKDAGDEFEAQGFLEKAIDAYLKGFESDWRDAYPGINAVTLMEISDPPDPRREQILPVVAYAVERRIASGKPDYWDYATRLELSFLANDEQASTRALAQSLSSVREPFEPETTARNLRLICDARAGRGGLQPWMTRIVEALNHRAAKT